ncbi:MAG: FtsW/RodA/SpoVE family cell cycle protein, partial [Bifidobacterium crudilactis]|nr:FtsW/RodA/SpoVE family cell cycle protein [Bifidobacterium crudilactis]
MRLKHIGLLMLAMAISAIGFFQLFRRTSGDASFTFIVLLLAVGALFVLLWALTARFQPYASQTILPCVLLLSSIGILLIARIDIANTALGNASDVATRQLVWLATALVLSCLLIVFLRDYRVLRRFSYVSMV